MSRPLAAVLTIGDEILRGDIIDSNKAHLARSLEDAGFEVVTARTVRDRIDEIVANVRALQAQVRMIAVTGGLGPTSDDLTAQALAQAFDRPVIRHRQALAQIEAHFERAGRSMAPTNLKQADLPQDCELLANPKGSAPGFALTFSHAQGPGWLACMPGVPSEMKFMLAHQVLSRVKERVPGLVGRTLLRTYRLMGRGESDTAQRLGDRLQGDGWAQTLAHSKLPSSLHTVEAPLVHYRAHAPELLLTLEFPQLQTWPVAQGACFRDLLDDTIASLLSPALYAIDEPELDEQCVAALGSQQLELAVAESCTGGALAQQLTAIPGVSSVFVGGIVAYSNALKTGLLGVSEDQLGAHGAVSSQVAQAMAHGVVQRTGARVGIGITGIAGPGGATEQKPVGTVFVAVRTPQTLRVAHLKLGGDRLGVRRRAAQWALRMVVDALAGRSTWLGSHGEQVLERALH